ncbi:uncharacterized protein G2W53_018659 [Senna tora]|uniref:Uncharacterized protein n=1 Tax=Senna tora TaxID=362788 RepID=A0A834WLA3_9FABA|nr:uncharacterized protein G2W53_018659 [Senna tora]
MGEGLPRWKEGVCLIIAGGATVST